MCKEKVTTPHASDDEAEPIDAELEAVAAKVMRRLTEVKYLLDIIAGIMAEGQESEAPILASSQQTPSKPTITSPK